MHGISLLMLTGGIIPETPINNITFADLSQHNFIYFSARI